MRGVGGSGGHRRGEREGEGSRAKDEGGVGYSYEALSFEQRDRLRANIAQTLSDTWQGTAERHATEGAQRLMQFAATMVPPGQIEPLIGVAIGRSSHAHTVKSGVEFAIGHFTRVVTEVQEQSQPRSMRGIPAGAQSSSRAGARGYDGDDERTFQPGEGSVAPVLGRMSEEEWEREGFGVFLDSLGG